MSERSAWRVEKQLALEQVVEAGSLILQSNELISPEREVVVCQAKIGKRGWGLIFRALEPD